MKNVLFIGDIHGRDDWTGKVHNALQRGVEVVFLGDYVDSFDINPHFIYENLEEIVKFKKFADDHKSYPKVTLLVGNHDMAYMWGKVSTSGFDVAGEYSYNDVFKRNWDLFDMAWGYQGTNSYTLATHAGVLRDFWNHALTQEYIDFTEKVHGEKNMPPHVRLNYLKDKASLLWRISPLRGGVHADPSPLWAHWSELQKDPMEGINQVVGHTSNTPPTFDTVSNAPFFLAKVDGAQGTAVLELKLD